MTNVLIFEHFIQFVQGQDFSLITKKRLVWYPPYLLLSQY